MNYHSKKPVHSLAVNIKLYEIVIAVKHTSVEAHSFARMMRHFAYHLTR